MNPIIEVAVTRTFVAEHSLPEVGVAQRHKHTYSVECGYSAAIDSALGCARPMQALTDEIAAVLSRLDGKYLNEILPVTPTAEWLACWILAQLSPSWEWVSIRAYDGFMCKVDRSQISSWIGKLRPEA